MKFRQTGLASVFLIMSAVHAHAECPTDALPAYAHNDYKNAHPLTDALRLGFQGVEADVFLIDGRLRVGHDRKEAQGSRTFEELYLEPLQSLVAQCGQLTASGQPFLLAVELKEASMPAYENLVALLRQYRALVETAPDRVTATPAVNVVLVGWHPPITGRDGNDALFGIQYRLRHVDVRRTQNDLAQLDHRVRLLSLDYRKTMGRWWATPSRRRRWLAMLRAVKAAAPGRLLRVHNVPAKSRIYAELLDAGVDLIGTKDLVETRRLLGVRGSARMQRL